MGLIARANGGTVDPVPEGVTVGICCGVHDLGTHRDERWDKDIHKVLLTWELPEHRVSYEKDGQHVEANRTISQKYRLSLHAKAQLRKDLESWRGKAFTDEQLAGFDLRNVLGKPCQLQVIHNLSADKTKTYANVGCVMALPKGMPAPKGERPFQWYSSEETEEIPETCPEWIADLIRTSKEWLARGEPTLGESSDASEPGGDDGMPF